MSIKKQLPEVEPVVLKPFHGIRPGVYILILFFAAILILSFLLFVLPGLVTNTAFVTFSEPIQGSGVMEDGKYLGLGNDGVYKTTGGNHNYSFIFEGEEYGKTSVRVERKVFFSLFSHKPTLITPEREYNSNIKEKVTTSFLSSLSTYSAVISAPSSFHYPPIFSNFAKNVVETGIKDVKDIWLFALSHITSEDLYKDYLEGRDILEKNSIDFSSKESLELESVISSIFNGEEINTKRKTELIEHKATKNGDFFSYDETVIEMGRDLTLNIENIKESPVTINVPSFSIASNLVTEHDWALFVSENPEWSIDNLDSLVSQGLVDNNYLKGITLSPYINSIRPIRNISYYAALAYTEWKSEKDGVEYHIPTEGEWYVSASSTLDKDYVTSLVFVEKESTSPTGMLGQLWEFTSTPFIPLMRLTDYGKVNEKANVWNWDDIIVKGGSYVSSPSSIDIDTVGISSKSQCSEFCSFRLANYE